MRGQSEAVETEVISLSTNILEHYSTVALCVDMMIVNRVAMLITMSRNIHYGTVHGLMSMKILVLLPMTNDTMVHTHYIAKSSPAGLVLANNQNVNDKFDDELNSINNSGKGIPGVNDNNTNIDIKNETTTKPEVNSDV